MKKAISLLLAFAVILGISSVAFAAEDSLGIEPKTRSILGRVVTATPGETTVSVEAGEIFMVHNGRTVVGTDTELRPDESYRFDLYYARKAISGTDAEVIAGTAKLTQADVGRGTVRIRTLRGSSAISSARVRQTGTGAARTFRAEIDTRANYGTKITDVEYSLNVVDTDTANTFVESIHTFTVGFNTISDSATDVGEDGVLTISNDAPVVLKDQWSDIARSANYRNITIESDDGNWHWKGRVTGMRDTNFSFNYDPNIELLNRFPEHEFKFLNFPAGVNFPTLGEMRIEVSDISDTFGQVFVYLYRDGRLTPVHGSYAGRTRMTSPYGIIYDSGADEIVFRTNYLGRFVITNIEITDTALVPEIEPEDEFEEPEIYPEPPAINPPTGVASSTGALLGIGLLTLVSGAAVNRKRKF
ncbi:MAG: hypothetical protein FWG94_02590 [Oscillospiraceae bacterium]|nr:hypothetical protein [Oscillospiraceae bacterium]